MGERCDPCNAAAPAQALYCGRCGVPLAATPPGLWERAWPFVLGVALSWVEPVAVILFLRLSAPPGMGADGATWYGLMAVIVAVPLVGAWVVLMIAVSVTALRDHGLARQGFGHGITIGIVTPIVVFLACVYLLTLVQRIPQWRP